MSVLTRLFGTKYNDDQLALQASTAIAEDPLLRDASEVAVESVRGVITLDGSVARCQRESARRRRWCATRLAPRASGMIRL